MVPGKSLAIISLTGQVWHPIGRPSGLARSSIMPAERSPAAPATATCVMVVCTNSLLVIADTFCLPKNVSKIHQVCGAFRLFTKPTQRSESPSKGARFLEAGLRSTSCGGLHITAGNNINLENRIGCRDVGGGQAQFAPHDVAALSDGAGLIEGNLAVAALASEAAVA